jgi:hypothetical protein
MLHMLLSSGLRRLLILGLLACLQIHSVLGDAVEDALVQWGESGPVERLAVVRKEVEAVDQYSRTRLVLGIHGWTNRVAHTHGLVLEASGTGVNFWWVAQTNESVAMAVARRTPIVYPLPQNWSSPFNSAPRILYAERFLADGTRQSLGSPDWDQPRLFMFSFEYSGSMSWLDGWLEVTRSNGEWSARNGSSTSVVGGPSIPGFDSWTFPFTSDLPTEVRNLDLDRDGLVDFVSVGRYSGPQNVISFGIFNWFRVLVPVGDSAIRSDPLRAPRGEPAEVYAGSVWTTNSVELATWTRQVDRFGGFSTVTGPFAANGDMGVRISSTNGTRYGWIHWSTNRIVNPSNNRNGLAWVPTESTVGWGNQSVMTGEGIGTGPFRMERMTGGRFRLRWLPAPGARLEKWIPGDPQGWRPFQPEASDSHTFDTPDSHALFRIRSKGN